MNYGTLQTGSLQVFYRHASRLRTVLTHTPQRESDGSFYSAARKLLSLILILVTNQLTKPVSMLNGLLPILPLVEH
jgi:hypothetical protein